MGALSFVPSSLRAVTAGGARDGCLVFPSAAMLSSADVLEGRQPKEPRRAYVLTLQICHISSMSVEYVGNKACWKLCKG